MENIVTLKQVLLKDVKFDEFFLLTDKVKYNAAGDVLEKYVYVRGDYVRSEKKYEVYPFGDVCRSEFLSGNRKVYVGFCF